MAGTAKNRATLIWTPFTPNVTVEKFYQKSNGEIVLSRGDNCISCDLCTRLKGFGVGLHLPSSGSAGKLSPRIICPAYSFCLSTLRIAADGNHLLSLATYYRPFSP